MTFEETTPAERDAMQEVSDLRAAREHTDELRHSEEPRWKRVRARLEGAGISLQDAAIARKNTEDHKLEFAIVVARDGRAFGFEFDWLHDEEGRRDLTTYEDARVLEWEELTEDSRDLYAPDLETGRKVLEREAPIERPGSGVPARYPTPGEVEANREGTQKLRTSDAPQWREARSRLLEKGVPPEDVVIAETASAKHAAGLLAVSRDERVFSFYMIFGFDREGNPVPDGHGRVVESREIPPKQARLADTGRPNPYRRAVFLARQLFDAD